MSTLALIGKWLRPIGLIGAILLHNPPGAIAQTGCGGFHMPTAQRECARMGGTLVGCTCVPNTSTNPGSDATPPVDPMSQADAEARARKAAEAARERAEAAARQVQLERERDEAASHLKGLGSTTNNGQLKGLDGDGTGLKGLEPLTNDASGGAFPVAKSTAPSALQKKHCPPITDSRIVDACSVEPWGNNLPKVEEIERSPAADRARKGLQAVFNHDWKTALAWWQEALQRDPGNAALRRSVDMAQWMVSLQARVRPAPAPYAGVFDAIRANQLDSARQAANRLANDQPALRARAKNVGNTIKLYQTRQAPPPKPGNSHASGAADNFDKLADQMRFAQAHADELMEQSLLAELMDEPKQSRRLIDMAIDLQLKIWDIDQAIKKLPKK